jgi:hypothetical protein
MKRVLAVPVVLISLGVGVVLAQTAEAEKVAQYDTDGQLVRPDPTGWPYVSASIGGGATNMMAPEGEEEEPQEVKGDFHVIQVNPEAFDHYAETGTFLEGTVFTMTFYALDQHELPGDRFWASEVKAMEVGVKDTQRFEDGWAFFRFEGGATTASAFPAERCQACHVARGATDSVFTQLYSGLPKRN